MTFVDAPSTATPLNAQNLNNLVEGIDESLTRLYTTEKGVFFVYSNSDGSSVKITQMAENYTVLNQSRVTPYIHAETGELKLRSIHIGASVSAVSALTFISAAYLEKVYIHNTEGAIGIADGAFASTDVKVMYDYIEAGTIGALSDRVDDLSSTVKSILNSDLRTQSVVYADFSGNYYIDPTEVPSDLFAVYLPQGVGEIVLSDYESNWHTAPGSGTKTRNIYVNDSPERITVYIEPGVENLIPKDYIYFLQLSQTYLSGGGGGSSDEPIYGVSGLYQSDPALTRTDDAVGMGFVINSSSGTVDSDFDDVFPWNETAIVTNAAGKFVSFPRMYFRVGADSSHRLTDVAVSKAPRGRGTWYEVSPFLYGCYGGSVSDSRLRSVSGVSRRVLTTRAGFRSYAAANGMGYNQLDLYHRTVVMLLWFIEFATKKSDSIMTGRISGSGTQGGSEVCQTGGTDNLGTPSGFETAYGQMRYHYIEDFIGNLQEYVDGVCCKGVGDYDYVTDDPDNFSDDTTGKTPLCYHVPNNSWITALGWDNDNPFMCMPAETNGGSDTTFFCDYSDSASASNPVLCSGANYSSAGPFFGLASFYHSYAESNGASRGGRLIKRL